MPGAAITEQIDPRNYKGTVRVKVGPAIAAFAGTVEVLELDVNRNTLKLIGKGADKGGSSASMELTATLLALDADKCVLQGHAEVTVNGKFAQFGGRMMTSVSDMILAQFAEAFSQKAQAPQQSAAVLADTQTTTTTSPASPPKIARELNALSILWALIKNFFAGMLGKKSS